MAFSCVESPSLAVEKTVDTVNKLVHTIRGILFSKVIYK